MNNTKYFKFTFLILNIVSIYSFAQSIEPILQLGHSKTITCMDVNVEGTFMVTGSKDNSIKVWNISTGQQVRNYVGHSASITSVAFSNNGLYIISSSADKTVRIWEFIKNPDNKILDKKYEFIQQQALRTGMQTEESIKQKYNEALAENNYCLQTYIGPKEAISSMVVDKSFKNFITLSEDNSLRFWNPLSVKEQLSIPTSNAEMVLVTSDASKYFILESDGKISGYKFSTKTKYGELSEAISIEHISISKDDKWMAGIDESSTVHIWDIAKGTKTAVLKGIKTKSKVVFMNGKTSVLFSTEEGLIEYDFKSMSKVQIYPLAVPITTHIEVSMDNKMACGISNEKDIVILDLKSGIVKNYLPSPATNYEFNILSSDGRYTYSLDNTSKRLSSVELFSGKIQRVNLPMTVNEIFVSGDSKHLMLTGDQLMIYTSELRLVTAISTKEQAVEALWPEGSDTIYIRYANQQVSGYNFKTKKEKIFIQQPTSLVDSKLLNSKYVAQLDTDFKYQVIDVNSGKALFETRGGTILQTTFCAATNTVAFYNSNLGIELWNIKQGKKIKEIQTGLKSNAQQLLFNQTGQTITILFADGRIKIFDTNNGYEIARRIEGKKISKLNPISYTPNEKFLFCASKNNTLVLWNWKDNKEIQIIEGKFGAIIFCPDNTYIASNKGVDLIAFKKGTEYYTFEQFDLHFNRPDKVLQMLDYADPLLIKSYQQAYNKRLKKLGFKNSFQGIGIHIPNIIIENSEELKPTTKESKVILKIKASDTDYPLRSIIISVNGVPEGGVKGIDISDKKTKEHSLSYELQLSKGMNQIKVWSMNEKGAESYKKNIQIVCDKPPEKPTLYLVVVGVSGYKNPTLNLNYAAKDVRDFIQTMNLQRDNYKEIIVDSLLNENATKEKIMTVKKRMSQTSSDDRVILFFAGHGLLDVNLDYYLATYDVDAANPATKGLSYDLFVDLVDAIPARNKLILMDACHSGEVDKDELEVIGSETKVEADITFRAIPGGTAVKTIGLNNSFEIMKQLFSDLRKSNGTTVISSAGGAEYAMEGDQWKNGVFTYCLQKALKDKRADVNKDGKISLSELQVYLEEQVMLLTNGKQRPSSRVENISNDWQIW